MRIRPLLVASCALAVLAVGSVTCSASVSAAPKNTTGFQNPFAGPAKYLGLAATQAPLPMTVNAPLGQKRADSIAQALGFKKSRALSAMQYTAFVSGYGVSGGTAASTTAARVMVTCLEYQTDTRVNLKAQSADGLTTYPHLGSYGLAVNESGALESVANSTNPCRQVNLVLEPVAACPPPAGGNPLGLPCGYMSTWMKANGASDTLAALYAFAYTSEVVYASKSQQVSGVAQLVTNTKAGGVTSIVGMPLASSVWLANSLIFYAISASSTGQVSYADFASYFTG
jgi:hypothetical protein